MSTRRKAEPAALPFEVQREPVGTVERAAVRDLGTLRDLSMLATGTGALEAAYKRAAREVDRAERKRDPWAAASAMRELRALRLEIAPTVSPMSGDDVADLLSNIAEIVERQRES